jgi:hypothetical protein
MAKFCGKVGYSKTVETSPGVWTEELTARKYRGEVIDNRIRRNQSSDSTNDNLSINNQISILADAFAMQNLCFIRYIEFMGVKWNVSDVTISRPRLILTLGGVYNGG